MSSKKVVKEDWKRPPTGHGPGPGVWGVKGEVANKCGKGIGTGKIGPTITPKVRRK